MSHHLRHTFQNPTLVSFLQTTELLHSLLNSVSRLFCTFYWPA